jgi:hypothetical protein
MACRAHCIPLAASLLLSASSAAIAGTYVDNFDSGLVNPTYWTIDTTEGSTLTAVNGRLEMVQGTGPMVGSGAHLIFNFAITGDFTVDVDYQLLNWPANNYERVGISTGAPYPVTTPLAAVARASDPNSWYYGSTELYASFNYGAGWPHTQSFTATTDSSGRLRMERVGQSMSGYYWKDSAWVLIGSYANASQLVPITGLTFGIWDFTSDTPGVKVAFDNFALNAPGTDIPLVPEPETWAMLAAGLGLLGLKLRRGA